MLNISDPLDLYVMIRTWSAIICDASRAISRTVRSTKELNGIYTFTRNVSPGSSRNKLSTFCRLAVTMVKSCRLQLKVTHKTYLGNYTQQRRLDTRIFLDLALSLVQNVESGNGSDSWTVSQLRSNAFHEVHRDHQEQLTSGPRRYRTIYPRQG